MIAEAIGHSYATEWSSDESGHWKECNNCDATSAVIAHTAGDVATCTTPQTCTVCGEVIAEATGHSYATEWSSDESGHWKECNNCDETSSFAAHTLGDWMIDTPATEEVNGSRHRECDICGYVIETETLLYIVTGADQSWNSDLSSGATIKSNGDIEDFRGVKVDGEIIGEEHYTVVSGSTILTLKPAYLATLSPGDHQVVMMYVGGSAQANLTISAVPPKNGEDTNPITPSQPSQPTTSSTDETDMTSPKTVDADYLSYYLIGGTLWIILWSMVCGFVYLRRKRKS
jgi:hypothetical protein